MALIHKLQGGNADYAIHAVERTPLEKWLRVASAGLLQRSQNSNNIDDVTSASVVTKNKNKVETAKQCALSTEELENTIHVDTTL